MSKHERDESSEAAPDSGTEPVRDRGEPEATDEFENDEERRFFSAPPAHDDEHTLPSLEPVVAEAAYGEDLGPEPTPAEREWLARAEARRATLQRWVGLAVVAGAAALVVAVADRYVSAKNETARNLAPAVLPADAPAPPKKTNATPSNAEAKSTHGASSSPPAPVVVPPAAPSATSVPVSVSPAVPSPTSVPVSVPPALPSATSTPVVAPPTTSASSAPASLVPRSAAPTASASPGTAPTSVASMSDAAGLRDKARTLLATGHSRDGVAFARAAVESDPLDARSYVLLGAGLQDLGDWAGARDVFQACTQKATRGPSGACQYFARR